MMQAEKEQFEMAALEMYGSVFALPEYLFNEVWYNAGEENSDNQQAITPTEMYSHQMNRLLPREWNMLFQYHPAFENAFKHIEEKKKSNKMLGG